LSIIVSSIKQHQIFFTTPVQIVNIENQAHAPILIFAYLMIKVSAPDKSSSDNKKGEEE